MEEIKRISILIVEDDIEFASIIGRMLRNESIFTSECHFAYNLTDALSLMDAEHIDIIVLDLGLPETSGLATLISVRQKRENTPIVVLTGEGPEEMGPDVLREGAMDYILKSDIRGHYLRMAINHAMQRHDLLQQLQDYQSHLEEIIEKRTTKLEETIDKLKSEIKQREEAEKNQLIALQDSVRREKEINALLQSSKLVLKHRNFDKSARAVFDICKNLLGATAGYVALLSEDGQENELLFLEAGGRVCTVNPDLPMPIRGLREKVYKTGLAVYENDFMNSQWQDLMPSGHAVLDNVLFAPLNIGDYTAGIIGLANKLGGFDDNDASLATAMAEIASIALDNSRTLESLEDSRTRFRELFDRMSGGVIIYESNDDGTSFHVKEINRVAMEIAMIDKSGYHGKKAEEVFPGIIHTGLLQALHNVWLSGKPLQHPPSLYQDGAVSKWLESYIYKLPNGELVEVFDDITQQKAIQDSLRKSEERYRSLIESCPDPIVVYDADGNVIAVNSAFQNIFGWKIEELYGKPLDFVPETNQEETKIMVDRMIRGNKVINFETQRFTSTGKIIDTDISATLFSNNQGKLVGYVVFIRDISVRKSLEKELRRNERNLRRILESLPTGIMMVNCKDYTIEYVNPVACEMVGLSSNEIVGKVCYSFVCPTEKGQCPVTDLHMNIEQSERYLQTSSGDKIPILKNVVTINIGGNDLLLESFIDISDLKKTQEETLIRKALEATIETAGAACHELNQPLQALMNLADAALGDLQPDHPVHNDLQDILLNSIKMASITQKLSNLTSYQTSKYSPYSNILDLDASSNDGDGDL